MGRSLAPPGCWVTISPCSRGGQQRAPCEHLQPPTSAQFGLGTVLQHTRTPSLRVAEFEDEDENEAPGENKDARRATRALLRMLYWYICTNVSR
jgi:hypothetical protein